MYTEVAMRFETIAAAMLHPVRRDVMAHLERGTMSMSQLSDALRIAPSTLTWHARVLEEAGLIVRTHSGREIRVESTCAEVEIVLIPHRRA
jgi:DNA-binding transcriptional ArsR family regulator